MLKQAEQVGIRLLAVTVLFLFLPLLKDAANAVFGDADSQVHQPLQQPTLSGCTQD